MAIFSDKVRLYFRFLGCLLPLLPRFLLQKFQSLLHHHTYTAVANAKNVVVIGGSFAGFFTAQQLIQSLPTGYRVILIEKNEHLHYVFAFPRFSVLQGKERLAFIPYDGLDSMAVGGIYERKEATAARLEKDKVILSNGEEVDFAFCIIATGASQPYPARIAATATDSACNELKKVQRQIAAAQKIAIVGAGAVGVELATDIKAYYPNKNVTLLSSRDCLLPSFGPKLRENAHAVAETLGVDIVLNARPKVEGNEGPELRYADGTVETFDLVIPCTGQVPNSAIVGNISPMSISDVSGRILVRPTLQLDDPALPYIFAIGDVAETGGPRMASAAFFQARVVAQNVLACIEGKARTLKPYQPEFAIEGTIKLTLGKTDYTIYSSNEGVDELLVNFANNQEDLSVPRAWKMYGVRCDTTLLQPIEKI